uniref:3-oxoadipate enol-lactonase n=1 Tax=Arhodomonas sp. Seminole TaxID=1204713 RepID=A0A076YJV9_9GAMM|nr:3-oxoadipate enol-lactonase [Arhodomonas sp. Seminole]
MPFLQAGDITTHYDLRGPADAPVVMLSNSIGTGLGIWDAVTNRLVPDFRVLRYDTRGHGLSDAPPGPYTIEGLGADAVALLDALGIDRVHFCGLSLGGMIAQQIAAAAPERLASVVCSDTATRIGTADMWQERARTARESGIETMADAILPRWFAPAFGEREPAALRGYRNMLCRTPAEGYAGACEAIGAADLDNATASIRLPALVIVGDADQATTPADARRLAETIPGARLVEIPNTAHLPCVEDPATFAERLTEFLREVES